MFCTELFGDPQIANPDTYWNDMFKLRSNANRINKTYMDFITYFVSCVVGKTKFKQNICSIEVSKFVTVSDESLALLILENMFARWKDMKQTGNHGSSKVPPKYTSGGKNINQTKGTTQKYGGWSKPAQD